MPDYAINKEMLDAILTVTRITSDNMRQALHDHFVLGHPQAEVAQRYGILKQQLGPHVRRIRGEIKPAFDAYAQSVLDAEGAKTGPGKKTSANH